VRLRIPSKSLRFVGLAMPGILFLAPGAWAQGADPAVREAYFRAVGEYFDVPLQEVTIIGEWELSADEVPVVFFLAQRAGVSRDALIGVRRGGRPWLEVAGRFGLGPRTFHIPLPEGEDLGSLSRAYGEFRRRPPGEWNQIDLADLDIVTLVNLRVLADQAGVPPLRVLRMREEAGSFLACYPLLIRR
jgi:hypothetical protein